MDDVKFGCAKSASPIKGHSHNCAGNKAHQQGRNHAKTRRREVIPCSVRGLAPIGRRRPFAPFLRVFAASRESFLTSALPASALRPVGHETHRFQSPVLRLLRHAHRLGDGPVGRARTAARGNRLKARPRRGARNLRHARSRATERNAGPSLPRPTRPRAREARGALGRAGERGDEQGIRRLDRQLARLPRLRGGARLSQAALQTRHPLERRPPKLRRLEPHTE